MWIRRTAIAAAMVWLVAGCAAGGRTFPTDKIPRIEPGLTTTQQVRDWFGEPLSIRTRGLGGSTWRYEQRDANTADTGTLSRIGSTVSGVLGGPRTRSPVNVAYTNETRHRLVVWFDQDDVVADYEYEKSETPSKRIY